MEAKELRIGNWVRYDGWHPDLVAKNRPIIPYDTQIEYIELDEYEGEDVYVIGSTHIRAFIDSYSLIPLTEEWLIKFGFTWRNTEKDYVKYRDNGLNQIVALFSSGIKTYYVEDTDEYDKELCDLQYVHQLQNLYFALTGEELNKQD